MHSCQKRVIPWALISSMLLVATAAANDPQLVEAVRQQDWDAAAELVGQGADVNTPQPDGTTALQWAAYHDHLATVERLLVAGANPDAANDYGVTAVSLAARNGSAAVLETLIEGGADPNRPNPTGETPLMTAALTGKTDAVKVLLLGQADPSAKESSHGQTALMWATSEGHLETAATLLEYGADIHVASDSGFTPLLFAARGGDIKLVQLLLSHGADVNESSEDGTTVLHVATVRGHVDLSLYLLDLGADVNADGPGYTPLHWVAGTWESAMTFDYQIEGGEWGKLGGIGDRKLELLNALLDRGANPNAVIRGRPPRFGSAYGTPPVSGGTPFFLAAQAHDIDVMNLLVERGADAMLASAGNTTALMATAMMHRFTGSSHLDEAGGIEALTRCLELGHDVNAVSDTGDTALHAVTLYGWDKMAEFLLDNGADPSPVNAKDQTPLRNAIGIIQSAMLREQPAVAAVLRRYGAIAPEVELECGVCPPPAPADSPNAGPEVDSPDGDAKETGADATAVPDRPEN